MKTGKCRRSYDLDTVNRSLHCIKKWKYYENKKLDINEYVYIINITCSGCVHVLRHPILNKTKILFVLFQEF